MNRPVSVYENSTVKAGRLVMENKVDTTAKNNKLSTEGKNQVSIGVITTFEN